MAKTTPIRWWRDDAERYMPLLAPVQEIMPMEFVRLEPQPTPDWLVPALQRAYEAGWRPPGPWTADVDVLGDLSHLVDQI